jgi:molybdopterin biosynthesis enzyme MoaB
MSILSRPVVGLLGRTLVVACSGSKKACAETWDALTAEVGAHQGLMQPATEKTMILMDWLVIGDSQGIDTWLWTA